MQTTVLFEMQTLQRNNDIDYFYIVASLSLIQSVDIIIIIKVLIKCEILSVETKHIHTHPQAPTY